MPRLLGGHKHDANNEEATPQCLSSTCFLAVVGSSKRLAGRKLTLGFLDVSGCQLSVVPTASLVLSLDFNRSRH
jgi:hypothetical protein